MERILVMIIMLFHCRFASLRMYVPLTLVGCQPIKMHFIHTAHTFFFPHDKVEINFYDTCEKCCICCWVAGEVTGEVTKRFLYFNFVCWCRKFGCILHWGLQHLRKPLQNWGYVFTQCILFSMRTIHINFNS